MVTFHDGDLRYTTQPLSVIDIQSTLPSCEFSLDDDSIDIDDSGFVQEFDQAMTGHESVFSDVQLRVTIVKCRCMQAVLTLSALGVDCDW